MRAFVLSDNESCGRCEVTRRDSWPPRQLFIALFVADSMAVAAAMTVAVDGIGG